MVHRTPLLFGVSLLVTFHCHSVTIATSNRYLRSVSQRSQIDEEERMRNEIEMIDFNPATSVINGFRQEVNKEELPPLVQRLEKPEYNGLTLMEALEKKFDISKLAAYLGAHLIHPIKKPQSSNVAVLLEQLMSYWKKEEYSVNDVATLLDIANQEDVKETTILVAVLAKYLEKYSKGEPKPTLLSVVMTSFGSEDKMLQWFSNNDAGATTARVLKPLQSQLIDQWTEEKLTLQQVRAKLKLVDENAVIKKNNIREFLGMYILKSRPRTTKRGIKTAILNDLIEGQHVDKVVARIMAWLAKDETRLSAIEFLDALLIQWLNTDKSVEDVYTILRLYEKNEYYSSCIHAWNAYNDLFSKATGQAKKKIDDVEILYKAGIKNE